MPHRRSAIKRWRQSLKRRETNRSIKSSTRTAITKALSAISSDINSAEDAVRTAIASLDRAAQKGVIHVNAASRGKARILKRYNFAVAGAVATAAAARPAAPPAPEKKAPAPRRRGLLARGAEKETPKEAPKRSPRTRAKAAEKPAAEKKPTRSRKSTTS